MENEVHSFYGNRLRVRVSGICVQGNSILMVNHRGISEGNFWLPPGGGIELGESTGDCLRREFIEEVGLTIHVKDFMFVCELIRPPLHAIELFFTVSNLKGEVKVGSDPESGSPSLISEAKFMTWKEIKALRSHELHGIFNQLSDPSKITDLRGFFKV